MNWFRTLMRNLIESIFGELVQGNPAQQVENMLKQLDQKTNVAAMARIRADDLHERLQGKIGEHDELGHEAEQFLRDGNEEAARRLLERQLSIQDEISRLSSQYATAQTEAEEEVQDLRHWQSEVRAREDMLPQIEADRRYVKARESLEGVEAEANLSNTVSQFDRTRNNLREREKLGRTKTKLERDPNAEIDREINEASRKRTIDQALADLKTRVEGTIDVEIVEEEDPLQAARQLAEGQRFQIPERIRERTKVEVKKS